NARVCRALVLSLSACRWRRFGAQPVDADGLQDQAFVNRFRQTLADLAQEIFLESDFRQMDPVPFAGPVDIPRRDLRHGDKSHAAVAEVGEADGAPSRFAARLLACDQVANVFGDGRDHRFDHISSFRNTDRDGRRLERWNGDANADREDILEGWIALAFVDEDKAAWIGEACETLSILSHHAGDSAKPWDEHREFGWQAVLTLRLSIFPNLGDVHGLSIGTVELCVGYPFDVAVTERRFENALGVADAAKAEMADIRLGSNKGDWHAVPYFTLAKISVHDECKFVGRSKAGRSLDGADDDWTGVLAELFPLFGGLFCVIDMANRNGVSLRTKPFDFVERQCRSGRDDEIIISKAAAVVEFYRVLAWQHMLSPSGVKANFQFFADLGEVDLDVFRLPPIDSY